MESDANEPFLMNDSESILMLGLDNNKKLISGDFHGVFTQLMERLSPEFIF